MTASAPLVSSAPLLDSSAPPTLIKPRNWPACFKENAALKAFLNSLTDYAFVEDPRFSNPFTTP